MKNGIHELTCEFLEGEPPEDKDGLVEFLHSNIELLGQISELCKKTKFYETCKDKRVSHIENIESKEPKVKYRAGYAYLQFLTAIVEAPSFVPVDCIAIANMPIIHGFLLLEAPQ